MEIILSLIQPIILYFFPVWILGTFVWDFAKDDESSDSEKKKDFSYFHPSSLIATCFNVGRIPFAPGTWGTLFGVYLLIWMVFLPKRDILSPNMMLAVFFILTLVICGIGIWAANVYMEKTGKHDPKEVVIDEVAGMFVAVSIAIIGFAGLLAYDHDAFRPLLFLSWAYLIVLFLLFRLFDITKPGIIGKFDREAEGGFGVMMDDIIAGIFAGITFFIIFFAIYYFNGFTWLFSNFFPDFMGESPPKRAY